MTRKHAFLVAIAAALVALGAVHHHGIAFAGGPAESRPAQTRPVVREIFIPFAELDAILQSQPRRVLLPREEYESLLQKAKKAPKTQVPHAVVLLEANYTANVEEERAQISGTLAFDVLEDGLQAVPLDFAGAALRAATLGDKPASIGRDAQGRLTLFLEGKGRQQLVLHLVAPLETSAARQVLNLRLPPSPVARMNLAVSGDVELKSGAAIVRRTVDAKAGLTRFELLPDRAAAPLVMTLNSHLERRQSAVTARTVLVDEVTQAYERLHASVSLRVLYQAVDHFRFAIPDNFEVTEVVSPLLARWAIARQDGRNVLDVRLRERTVDSVLLNISAVRTSPALEKWELPRFEPLDVVSQGAVVGLLVEDRLATEAIRSKDLLPIDTAVLRAALPASVFIAEPGAPPVRPIVAYYAPQMPATLSASFTRPAAEMSVNTNLLLVLEDGAQRVHGGFLVAPAVERLFALEFSVPAGWEVRGVTAGGEKPTDPQPPLPFERFGAQSEAGRVLVRLPQGAAPGKELRVYFEAVRTVAGWPPQAGSTVDASGKLRDVSAEVAFPAFAVIGATRDVGAIAVDARDDMVVKPKSTKQLTPLDEAEKARYALAGVASSLAYRYTAERGAEPYEALLTVERTRPRVTAKTFSFFRIDVGALVAHYEVAYQVDDARCRELSFLLDADTPVNLGVVALDNVKLKDVSQKTLAVKGRKGQLRQWTAVLEQPARGRVRLAVDFQRPLSTEKANDVSLPVIEADAVAYQSGHVAVEGGADLDIKVTPAAEARRVDAGELVDAEYQPGRRLLGAYAFAGQPKDVLAAVARHDQYGIQPAIVESAEVLSEISPDGTSLSQASFQLRTKAVYLQIHLPEGSKLWSVLVDGRRVKPQREETSQLVSLPAGADNAPRKLQITYQTAVDTVAMLGKVRLPAPLLRLRSEKSGEGQEVPLAQITWRLRLPSGYDMVSSDGTVFTPIKQVEPAAIMVLKGLGLVAAAHPSLSCSCEKHAREAARQPAAATDIEAIRSPYILKDDDRLFTEAPKAKSVEGDLKAAEPPREVVSPPKSGAKPPAPAVAPAPTPAPPAPAAEKAPEKPADMLAQDSFAQPGTDKKADETGRPDTAKGNEEVAKSDEKSEEPVPEDRDELQKTEAAGGTTAIRATRHGAVPPRAVTRFEEGFSSLQIDLQKNPSGGNVREVVFQSLGGHPRIEVSLVHRTRLALFGWVLVLCVLFVGWMYRNRSGLCRTRLILAIVAVGTVLPMIPGCEAATLPMNMAVYAAVALVPYYLAAGLLKRFARLLRGTPGCLADASSKVATTAGALLVFAALASAASAQAPSENLDDLFAPPPTKAGQLVPNAAVSSPLVKPFEFPANAAEESAKAPDDADKKCDAPVKVPEDAVILPYDPASQTGIRDVQKMLVPYDRYVELWNLAHPDKKLDVKESPVPYALASASYKATLEGDQHLTLDGRMTIDLLTDDYAEIPLAVAGGVLARAELDGKAARLNLVQVSAGDSGKGSATIGLPMLYVKGRGRHELQLTVRLRLERRGGWRVVEGAVPTASACSLTLAVPRPQTEVRLGEVTDRANYETQRPDQAIETALNRSGAVRLQWRAKVAEGHVDRSFAAQSESVLDVQEDGLRLLWNGRFELRRSQRDSFTLSVPEGYLVEKVDGPNVRGWEVRKAAAGQAGQSLEVMLLKAVRDNEHFTLRLWKAGAVGRGDLARFDVPVVSVPEALLENGRVTLRRSPMLRLRTAAQSGVTRADLASVEPLVGSSPDDSPLGLKPFESYRFAATPFSLSVEAAAIASKTTATVHTLLKIDDFEHSLESQIRLAVEDRPIYSVEVMLPEGLKVEQVLAPGGYSSSVTKGEGRSRLSVHLTAGAQGELSLVVRGQLARGKAGDPIELPRLEVVDAQQSGEIAVQVDPVYDVAIEKPENCQPMLLERLDSWLNPKQREATRVALQYRAPDYRGSLRLTARQPLVHSATISNVRVTDRAIEETILLDFTIEKAGIRQIAFLLPGWMSKSRIRVPMLREKTVEPIGGEGSPVRVRLQLQDEVTSKVRVLVENDRPLAGGVQAVPLPTVETGSVNQQFVALEGAGRDELIVEKAAGMEPLVHQQAAWNTLSGLLGSRITQAYMVAGETKGASLTYSTHARKTVETSGARILLAETTLVLDANGTYRAQQLYRIQNTTRQFLLVELPEGASLWTAEVGGEAVKPTKDPAAGDDRQVRVPLVKTAPGELDYPLVLKYGGKLPAPGVVAREQFPLIHAIGIDVEVSHVELHLPETHDWYGFAGTMRKAEEGNVEAERLSYESKRVLGLVETLRGGESFSKVRAAANLKTLVDNSSSMSDYDYGKRVSEGYLDNADATVQRDYNKRVLDEAAKELKELDRQEEKTARQEKQGDNRSALNAEYGKQQVSRARNVVNDLGGNWDAAAVQPSNPGAQAFNPGWLNNSQLDVQNRPEGVAAIRAKLAAAYAGSAGNGAGLKGSAADYYNTPPGSSSATDGSKVSAGYVDNSDATAGGKSTWYGRSVDSDSRLIRYTWAGDANLDGKVNASDFSELSFDFSKNSGAQRYQGDLTRDGKDRNGDVNSDDRQAMAQRYQQKVASGSITINNANSAGDTLNLTGSLSGNTTNSGSGLGIGGAGNVTLSTPAPPGPQGGAQPGGKPASGPQGSTVAKPRPVQAVGGGLGPVADGEAGAGLASLSFELPLRGKVYRFTTPGGDIELSARGVSNRAVGKLVQLAVVAVAILLIGGVAWLVARGRFRVSRPVAFAVGLLGLMLLLVGLLVTGPVLIVLAVVWLKRAQRPLPSPAPGERQGVRAVG